VPSFRRLLLQNAAAVAVDEVGREIGDAIVLPLNVAGY